MSTYKGQNNVLGGPCVECGGSQAEHSGRTCEEIVDERLNVVEKLSDKIFGSLDPPAYANVKYPVSFVTVPTYDDVRVFLVKDKKKYELTFSNFFSYTPLQQQGLLKFMMFHGTSSYGARLDFKSFIERYDLFNAAEEVVDEDNSGAVQITIFLDVNDKLVTV